MRKILAVMLSCALVLAAFASTAVLTASAEAADIVFSAQSVEAQPGDTITVDISVSENHYMVNGQIWVEYDPTCLEIQTVWDDEDNPYFEDINTKIFKSSYMWAFAVPEAGIAKMAFATSSSKGTTAGGVMYTLTFKVLEGATTSEINIVVPEMCANDGVGNGGEDFDVVPTAVAGVVTIPSDETVPGDIDGDGMADVYDAKMAFDHVNGTNNLDDEMIARADQNGDGEVTLLDVARVFYIANGVL